MSWLEGSRARLRLLFNRNGAESRMTKEIGFHIDMETERLVRERGLDPTEARRRALVAFGGVERHKEELRDGRGRAWFDAFSLDLKLGGRMLVKYPGLTVVGGLAMAFAICVGTVIFQVLALLLFPALPLPAGERIVHIQNWDVATNDDEPRALYDFVLWRNTVRSVTQLGAWRDATRNLIVVGGDVRPVAVAEITASGFAVAGAEPFMGRVLVEADERTAAPAVAVIGYEVWRARFGSDPGVLGRTVQLGNDHVTIVGVMREGFEFPVAHDVWTPLRAEMLNQAPRSGPPITIFGVLVSGATIETAQAELTTVGRSTASEQRATHEHLQPRVQPFAKLFLGAPRGEDFAILFSIYVFVLLLVVLVCSNVALLMFARAATREDELVMRSALGANRSRIVMQMFVEALVLGGVAALVGLVVADVALRNWTVAFLEVNIGRLPFWFDLRVSPGTVLYALGLTVLASAIAGVVPALKVTRGMGSRIKQAAPGAGGLQFGGVWTAVIVAQVAVTVAFPAIVYMVQWQLRHTQAFDVGFAAEEYLAVRIVTDAPPGATSKADGAGDAHRAALGPTLQELRRRVETQPEVAGVAFVDRLPGGDRPDMFVELSYDGVTGQMAVAPETSSPPPSRVVTVAAVEPSYFDALGAPLAAGRAFTAADLAPGVNVAIVDQGFVDLVLQGRHPIGQQVRFMDDGEQATANPNPWFEIIGVVKDLDLGSPNRKDRAAGLYIPAPVERFSEVYMLVHARGEPIALSPKVREIAAAVDPTLGLSGFQRGDEALEGGAWLIALRVSMVMTVVALLLSLAGIYAVMSFIVARRTREIGVRVALGATRARVVGAIFRRPLIQVGLGILVGAALIAAGGNLETEMPGLTGVFTLTDLAMLVAYAIVMLGVCLLACLVPTRRALGVAPTIALRMD
jgi:putative ABC transport system permease protein